MSRAFVKEQDDAPEHLAGRPVSSNANFVTKRGLVLIDFEIEELRRKLAKGQHDDDNAAIARASRDLRYWSQRRASAQVVEPPRPATIAAFATRVTIQREDGRKQVFAIVGEDEANPAKGLIAYSSPMARALIGRPVGELIDGPGGEIEILKLEAVDAEG